MSVNVPAPSCAQVVAAPDVTPLAVLELLDSGVGEVADAVTGG